MFAFLLTTLYILCGVLCFWLACHQQVKRLNRRMDRQTLKDFMLYYGLLWPIGACVFSFICVIIIWDGICELILKWVNGK